MGHEKGTEHLQCMHVEVEVVGVVDVMKYF